MPAKTFFCKDGGKIEIDTCLSFRGCRMKERCAPLPYLNAASYDRVWNGISPSSAGSDARLIWLKATKNYAVDPASRAFALLGTAVHGKLALHEYNVLAEEKLSDEQMEGTADLLEKDENEDGYVITDYKTFGSYKIMKCLGIVSETVQIKDDNGELIRFKSGKNKGEVKTRKEIKIKPEYTDIKNEALQLNRYRLFFENNGFHITRMQLFAIVRDGGTMAARSRMITENIYIIPVPMLNDAEVLDYYSALDNKVKEAFKNNYAPKCNKELSWDGRRCNGFCEVADYCKEERL